MSHGFEGLRFAFRYHRAMRSHGQHMLPFVHAQKHYNKNVF